MIDGLTGGSSTACIPCRRRKVRCDLGPVDNPHDPPCSRCRREAKECFFSAVRRKKKNGEDESDGEQDVVDGLEGYEIKGGRKRLRPFEGDDDQDRLHESLERPRTPGGSIGRLQPLRRPAASRPMQFEPVDPKTSEQTVNLLQSTEVHGGHDALKLLYEAAAVHQRSGSRESGQRPRLNGASPSSGPAVASPIADKVRSSYSTGPNGHIPERCHVAKSDKSTRSKASSRVAGGRKSPYRTRSVLDCPSCVVSISIRASRMVYGQRSHRLHGLLQQVPFAPHANLSAQPQHAQHT